MPRKRRQVKAASSEHMSGVGGAGKPSLGNAEVFKS
jgi:hypothetical protein